MSWQRMDQLRKDGWYVNDSQISEFFDDGIIPKVNQEVLKTILNEDLRHFGEASIINLHKKEESIFVGPCVLQLLRYRNVSVPRIKEELNQTDPAHSIIRLFFTDGHTSISALVLQTIPGISSETPPGTKVLITGSVPVEGNFSILDKKNVKVLGGRVEEMIEKWNVEKSSVRADGFKSSVGKGTGAPKWVSFGKRGQKGQLEKGFKANSVMPKTQKEGDNADDFSKNRAEILKELESDTAKTFAKPNLAPPPVKAPPPPKERTEAKPSAPRPPRKGRGRKNSEDGPDVDVGEYANHKPSGPATLFDFIGGEEKEIVQAVTEKTARMGVSENKRFENTRGGNNNPSSSSGSSFKKPGFDRKAQGSAPVSSRGGRTGDRAPPRNDTRAPKTFSDRNAGSSGGPSKNQAPKRDQNQEKRDYGRQENRGQNQNRPNTTGSTQNYHQKPADQYSQGRQNRPNHQGSAQNFNQAAPQNPRGSQNYQGTPRGNDGQQFQREPPSRHQGFQQNQAAHQNPRGNQNYQQNQGTRGNHGYQQNQGPPRGSQGYQQNQGPPQNQYENQNFQGPPRGNQQFQQGPPRGNQGYQQNQGPPRGNPRQGSPQWHIGSQCLATWTDGNIYPATIIDLLPNRAALVRYNEYGNTHTIPVDFLIFP